MPELHFISFYKSTLKSISVLFLLAGITNCSNGFQTKVGKALSAASGESDPVAKTCVNPALRGSAESASRRLTKNELVNTYTSLFGAAFTKRTPIAAAMLSLSDDSQAYQREGFEPALQSGHVDALVKVGEAIVTELRLFTAAGSTKFVVYGACVGVKPITQACYDNFVSSMGAKIWRRPLSADEKTSLRDKFFTADRFESFEETLLTLLITPDFAMLLERGVADGGRRRLNSYEVAARLSYLTIGSMPDAALMAAAAKDELATKDQITAQVTRLMATTEGMNSVVRTLTRYVDAENIPDPNTAAAFAAGLVSGNDSASTNLGVELIAELQDFIRFVVFEQNGTYQDLMTSQKVFSKTQRLAKIYGTPVWAVGTPPPSAPVGERSGIWTRAAILSTTNSHTKPFTRGNVFRRNILCLNLPSPDPSILAVRDTVLDEMSPLDFSNREIHHAVTDSPACLGCHGQLNPIGFGLERFSEIGQFRKTELVLDAKGAVLASHPVDASVSLVIGAKQLPRSIDIESLMRGLTDNELAKNCFAETLFRERRLRMPATEDGCLLEDLGVKLRGDRPILELFIESIANEDIFWSGGTN